MPLRSVIIQFLATLNGDLPLSVTATKTETLHSRKNPVEIMCCTREHLLAVESNRLEQAQQTALT